MRVQIPGLQMADVSREYMSGWYNLPRGRANHRLKQREKKVA